LSVVRGVSRVCLRPMPSVEQLEDSWGQRKGGVIKAGTYEMNLSLEGRRRGGLHSARRLKRRLGRNFPQYWKSFSSRGGITTLERKTSLLRKAIGPCGEKMFNDLEVAVAQSLFSRGISYEYEPRLDGPKPIVPDFLIGTRIIECTRWTDTKRKARSLARRLAYLHKHFPNLSPIIVTTGELLDPYRRHLKGIAKVVSLEEFEANPRAILRGLYRTTGPHFTGARPLDFKESRLKAN
jgi:hypothetical protein